MLAITLITVISYAQMGQTNHASNGKVKSAATTDPTRVHDPGYGYHPTKWRRWGDTIGRQNEPVVKLDWQVIVPVTEPDSSAKRPMIPTPASGEEAHREGSPLDRVPVQSARTKAVISAVHARGATNLPEATPPATRATIVTVRNSRKGIAGASELQ